MATKKRKTIQKEKGKKKMDIGDLLGELQARFDAIDVKLDAILSGSAALSRMVSTEHDPSYKTHATLPPKPPIPRDRDPRERKMYKAVCAECGQDCEVPFVPKGDRPVYCKACYSNIRKQNSPRNIPTREEVATEIIKTLKIDMTGSPSKPSETKKTRKVRVKK